MEKLISGASTGSSGKRAGTGPTESAPRPRRGDPIERENQRSGHREFAGTRSRAGADSPTHQAEKPRPAARSNRPPRASRRHCRRRRRPLAPHPLARHHVCRRRRRRSQRLPDASGSNLFSLPVVRHSRPGDRTEESMPLDATLTSRQLPETGPGCSGPSSL